MTPTAKRYITLDKQYFSNDKKAEKYESGYYYDPIRGDIWRKKAITSMNKQQELILSEQDKNDIEEYYQCADMFDR
jgi:hypothetical protein